MGCMPGAGHPRVRAVFHFRLTQKRNATPWKTAGRGGDLSDPDSATGAAPGVFERFAAGPWEYRTIRGPCAGDTHGFHPES